MILKCVLERQAENQFFKSGSELIQMASIPVKSEKNQIPPSNLSPTVYHHRSRKNRQSQRTSLMKRRRQLAEKQREISIAFASSEEVVTVENR